VTELVAGVDSSTQATKVVVCDAATGEVVRHGRAAHPEGTEVDPEHWWRAFGEATEGGLLDGVSAIGVGGQQHGMVTLDESGAVVRPALLWNDTRSAEAARDLVDELGGPLDGKAAWAEAVGSVPLAAFTVTKLRWLAEHEPESVARTSEVVLPHDWVTARILGGAADHVAPGTATTDRGDASGTGYWSPATGGYRLDLLERALGKQVRLPRVAGPTEVVGSIGDLLVSAGSGDNMAAALGLNIGPGDVVVSLGTSGTVFGVHDRPTAEETGIVAGFADATGRFLPLVCTLNAARVLGAVTTMLGVALGDLDELALAAPAGAGGLSLLPYLDGERTPDLPAATGTIGGLTRANSTPQHLARAAVEGMLCGLADGVDALVAQGLETHRVLLIGGAARSEAVQRIAPDLFGAPIVVPAPAEYVALGGARQAAWALEAQRSSSPEAPSWPPTEDVVRDPVDLDAGGQVREHYRALRLAMHPES
jgi:xylulokinase